MEDHRIAGLPKCTVCGREDGCRCYRKRVIRQDFKFNLNYRVKVRLKQRGIDILRGKHDELDNIIRSRGGKGLDPFTIKIDDDGYTSFQMWDLMGRLGAHLTLGFDPPFHPDVIICDGEVIDRG